MEKENDLLAEVVKVYDQFQQAVHEMGSTEAKQQPVYRKIAEAKCQALGYKFDVIQANFMQQYPEFATILAMFADKPNLLSNLALRARNAEYEKALAAEILTKKPTKK